MYDYSQTIFPQSLIRFLLAGILLFNSVTLGPAKEGKKNPKTREVPIGLRLPDGQELHFTDFARLEAALGNGDVSSGGSGCLGLSPLHLAVVRHPGQGCHLAGWWGEPEREDTGRVDTSPPSSPVRLLRCGGSSAFGGSRSACYPEQQQNGFNALYSPSSCISCEGKEQQEASRKEIATRFLEAGVDPDARDIAGVSALHYAAMSPDAQEATAELLVLGADPQAHDHDGVPVSFYASFAGNTGAAELTRLAAGDPVDAVAPEGKTREEWISAKRTEMDASRHSSKPAIITGPAASAPAGIKFEYGCHYWHGMCHSRDGRLCYGVSIHNGSL